MVELACVPCRDQGLCGWPEPPTLLAGRGWRCKQPLESRHEPAEPAPRLEPACCLRRRFKGLLSKLGLFSKTGKLLVLGLDNAGKSTLLTLLVRNEVVPHAPTHQPVTDMITIGSMKMRAVDMGGHEIARRMWEMYSQDADGLTLAQALALTLTLTLTLSQGPGQVARREGLSRRHTARRPEPR